MENLTYSDNEQYDELVFQPNKTNSLQNVQQSMTIAPIRTGPQLNDWEGEPLCTHVVSELPPQYDFIFPPGFEHPEEESPENAAILERAFIRTNIIEAGGFKLKFEGKLHNFNHSL